MEKGEAKIGGWRVRRREDSSVHHRDLEECAVAEEEILEKVMIGKTIKNIPLVDAQRRAQPRKFRNASLEGNAASKSPKPRQGKKNGKK